MNQFIFFIAVVLNLSAGARAGDDKKAASCSTPTGLKETNAGVCTIAKPLLSEVNEKCKPKPLHGKPQELIDAEIESESFPHPAVASLVENYRDGKIVFNAKGGKINYDELALFNKNSALNVNDTQNSAGAFYDSLRYALSPSARTKFDETLSSAKNNSTAVQNLANLRKGLSALLIEVKNYPEADAANIVSGYLENFFGDQYSNHKKQACKYETVSRSAGDVPQQFAYLKQNAAASSVKNSEFSAGKFSTSKIDEDLFKQAGAAHDADVQALENLYASKTSFDNSKYIPIYKKDRRNLNDDRKSKICPEAIKISTGNAGALFADNSYLEKEPVKLSAEERKNFDAAKKTQQETIKSINDIADKNGTIQDFSIQASCSKLKNTATHYKSQGIDHDLKKFEDDVLPLVEDKEAWAMWLADFKSRIKDKADPFALDDPKKGFEDLSRLRSLKMAQEMLDQSKLKKVLKGEIKINWAGENGDGTTGENVEVYKDDLTGVKMVKVKTTHIDEKTGKSVKDADVPYDPSNEKYANRRYNRATFNAEVMKDVAQPNGIKSGNAYYVTNLIFMSCGEPNSNTKANEFSRDHGFAHKENANVQHAKTTGSPNLCEDFKGKNGLQEWLTRTTAQPKSN